MQGCTEIQSCEFDYKFGANEHRAAVDEQVPDVSVLNVQVCKYHDADSRQFWNSILSAVWACCNLVLE